MKRDDWISTKKIGGYTKPRPPKPGEPCLVSCGPGSIIRYSVGVWEIGHGWKTPEGRKLYDVTHYQPIVLWED